MYMWPSCIVLINIFFLTHICIYIGLDIDIDTTIDPYHVYTCDFSYEVC
jgi:hypothetical protein